MKRFNYLSQATTIKWRQFWLPQNKQTIKKKTSTMFFFWRHANESLNKKNGQGDKTSEFNKQKKQNYKLSVFHTKGS